MITPHDSSNAPSEFASTMREFRSLLERTVWLYANSAPERDDLRQELCIALWQAVDRFRGESSLTTFVFHVLRNSAISYLRRQRRHRDRLIPTEHDQLDEFQAPQMPADLLLARTYEARALRSVTLYLPENLRRVVELKLLDLSDNEIARRTGLQPTNVSVRLTRARKKIRAQLTTRRLGSNRPEAA